MSKEQEISNLFDQYLKGELEGDKLVDFEKILSESPELQKELELEKILKEAVQDNSLLEWKNALQIESKKANRNRKIKIAILILVICAIPFSYLLWQKEEIEVENKDNTEIELEVSKEILVNDELKNEKIDTNSIIEKAKITTKQKERIEKETNIESEQIVKNVKTTSTQIAEEIPKTVLPSSEKKEEIEKKQINSDPCKDSKLDISFSTTATCNNENEGEIKIEKISGSKGNFMYMLKNQSDWQKTNHFTFLASGEYEILVKDNLGCISSAKSLAKVEEKICYTPELGFNPDFEKWEYKGDWTNSVKVEIMNKVGQIIYKTEVNDIFVWDGKDNRGEKVASGLYRYYFTTEKGEKITGSVSVVY